ncbi:MAG TPA: hypothetical protein PK054_09630 [Anaerohalosphaeraceae bacterium]|nr:hypothetical protein [Anaerohalosphaeraceae bacterium]HPP56823.1 hypothetical protein [Anaerohalosphaeraceae bacterium]
MVQEELKNRAENPQTDAAQFKKQRAAEYLEENRRYLGNAYQGLAIVQTAAQKVSQIEEKLLQMKNLAHQAAGGAYEQEEILAFQDRYSELLCEITEIAVNFRPGGFAMLSFTGFGTVGIEIEREQKIEVDSMDMTASGLGLLQAADLTRSPKDALMNVELALEETAAYKQHLKESERLLEKALDILNDEREAILPAVQSIREKYSARQTIRQLISALSGNSPLLTALYARVQSDRASFLLSNRTEDE